MDLIDLNALSIDGLPLPPDANYAARKALYDTLGMPDVVDRWLISTSRCPNVGFLKDYLMISNPYNENVFCVVEQICKDIPVRKLISRRCHQGLIHHGRA